MAKYKNNNKMHGKEGDLEEQVEKAASIMKQYISNRDRRGALKYYNALAEDVKSLMIKNNEYSWLVRAASFAGI